MWHSHDFVPAKFHTGRRRDGTPREMTQDQSAAVLRDAMGKMKRTHCDDIFDIGTKMEKRGMQQTPSRRFVAKSFDKMKAIQNNLSHGAPASRRKLYHSAPKESACMHLNKK